MLAWAVPLLTSGATGYFNNSRCQFIRSFSWRSQFSARSRRTARLVCVAADVRRRIFGFAESPSLRRGLRGRGL